VAEIARPVAFVLSARRTSVVWAAAIGGIGGRREMEEPADDGVAGTWMWR
jgi:hypothetical protein